MKLRNTFAVLSITFLMAGCAAPSNNDVMMDDHDDAMMEDSMKKDDKMMDSDDDKMMEDDKMEKEDAMMEGESSLTFVGGSSIIDHPGGFADFTVEVGDSSNLAGSTLEAVVNVESIYSDSNGLTGHLKREDFFDTANYPTATFTSTSITGDDSGYDIVGDLTIKGITKSIVMNATMEGNVLTAEFDLPRKEFGIGNDSYGDKLLDEFVPVQATVYLQ